MWLGDKRGLSIARFANFRPARFRPSERPYCATDADPSVRRAVVGQGAAAIRVDTFCACQTPAAKLPNRGYSLDDMNASHNQSRKFLQIAAIVRLLLHHQNLGVVELKALGCPRVEFTGNAFDPAVHRPVESTDADRRAYECDVGFVGTSSTIGPIR